MSEWVKKQFKKGKIGFGGSGIESGESSTFVDVKKFEKTVENISKAVHEGGHSFCPPRDIFKQGAEKWGELDSEVKEKLKILNNLCGCRPDTLHKRRYSR